MAQSPSASVVDVEIANWRSFLKQTVNSFVKWDLVRFFHENPHTADTADNIATFIGRDVTITARDLDALVDTGVISKTNESGMIIYRLSSEPKTRDQINRFVYACHDREFRIKAINQVLAVMRDGQREH